jgi:hypothetical protein
MAAMTPAPMVMTAVVMMTMMGDDDDDRARVAEPYVDGARCSDPAKAAMTDHWQWEAPM